MQRRQRDTRECGDSPCDLFGLEIPERAVEAVTAATRWQLCLQRFTVEPRDRCGIKPQELSFEALQSLAKIIDAHGFSVPLETLVLKHHVQHIYMIDDLPRRDKGRDHIPALC